MGDEKEVEESFVLAGRRTAYHHDEEDGDNFFSSVDEVFDNDDFGKEDMEFDLETEFNGTNVFQSMRDLFGNLSVSIISDRYRKELGTLLDRLRSAELGGDCLDLAGRLFPSRSSEDLRLRISKQLHPTEYLLQLYCKDIGKQATVVNLIEHLLSMRRLDTVAVILAAVKDFYQEHNEKPLSGRGKMLTMLKRKIFKEDDTVSIGSVGSNISLSSWTSIDSLCSRFSVNVVDVPLGNRPPTRNDVFSKNPDENAKNSLFVQKNSSKMIAFVVFTLDMRNFSLNFVSWLRQKGIDARSIETDKLKYEERPYQYVNQLLQQSDYVLIVCSKELSDLVENHGAAEDGHSRAVKFVHKHMCDEHFHAGGYLPKYIPVLSSKMSISCIPSPLHYTVASIFTKRDKGKRDDLLRRLYKEEKYKLPPIGKKPVIKSTLITGEFSDFLK